MTRLLPYLHAAAGLTVFAMLGVTALAAAIIGRHGCPCEGCA